MKKFLSVLVLICIAAAGVWYFTRPEPVTVSAEKFLPKDTLISIEIIDMEKGIKEFKASRLGMKLAGIDIAGAMEKVGTDEKKIAGYRSAEKKVLDLLESAAFNELFGREIRFALLPLHDKLDDPKDLLKNFILIARPRHNAGLVELAGSLFTGELKAGSQTYGEYEIKSLDAGDGVSLHYTFSSGLMLASLDDGTIRNAIDLQKAAGNSLSENSEYVTLREKISRPEGRTFIFADLKGLMGGFSSHLLDALPEETEAKQIAAMKEQLALMGGVKTFGYTSYKEGPDMIVEKMLVNVDRAGVNPRFSSILGKKPGENRTLAMVPDEALIYNWSNTFDLKEILNELMDKKGMNESASVQMKRTVETMTGVDFDELVGAAGGESAFILSDINATGLFPIARLAIVLEVSGEELIEQALTTLSKGSGMVFQKQETGGIEIKSIMLPFGEEIQPSYTFYDGFWIVAINPQMIKDMIKAKKEGSGIGSSPSFISVDRGLSGQNNGITFVKAEKFIESLEKLVAWGGNMAAMKGPEVSNMVNVLLTDVVNPLLDGLKMYKAIGSRTFMDGEAFEINTFTRVGG